MEGQQDKQPTQEKQELGPDGKPLSKKALKKLEKGKQKEEQKAKKQAQAAPQEEEATSGENWGLKEPVRSATREGKHFVRLSEITPALSGQTVLFRARLQNIRAKGNLAFLFLRQRSHSIQAVAAKSEKISKSMLKWLAGIPKESLVDVTGTVKEGTVEKATQHNVEIEVASVFAVSLSVPTLPLQMEDAERPRPVFEAQEAEVAAIQAEIDKHKATLTPEQIKAGDAHLAELEKKKESAVKFPAVKEDTRLDNRILDLRTCTSQAVFTIQSGVVQLFKDTLLSRGFMEIHSPKLIGTASEGGAEVFEVKYFDRKAYLAQSPQLYKQMAVCGDLERVFEIGPVFRAEKSFTHRHLTEFVGLDIEMAFYEHYYEVLDVLEAMLLSIFKGLKEKFAHEIEVVKRQYPFEDFQIAEPVPRVKFSDAIAMLREAGETIGDYDDLSTPQERKLGALVKQKYKTDFYVLDKFPLAIRPFYTMPDPANPNYSNSYDLFMRGEEICSGAQRVHVPELLEERAKVKGVGLEGIRPYIEAFRYGAPPHAGGGIGLERVVMLYLNLGNIRRSSLFPRDPVRLAP